MTGAVLSGRGLGAGESLSVDGSLVAGESLSVDGSLAAGESLVVGESLTVAGVDGSDDCPGSTAAGTGVGSLGWAFSLPAKRTTSKVGVGEGLLAGASGS